MESTTEPTPKRPADEVLRAYSPRPAVRRLNRAALAIVFLAVALLFAGRTIVGLFHRYAAQIAEDERRRQGVRAPDETAGPFVNLPDGYDSIGRETPPPTPVTAPQVEPPEPPPIDPNILKQLEALRREQENAVNSTIQFPNAHPSSPDSAPGDIAADIHQFAAVDSFAPSTLDRRNPSYDERERDFFRNASGFQPYVRSPFLPPRSPYEIKAGTIIPAALITPINTDLPGDVVGAVTANLYDTVSGRYLLIPQGARLVGRYNSEVHKGQNRALIAWQRLILPNGYSIVLEAMPGTDAQGLAGMADQVDWHAKRLAGATVLSTLIALGGNYAANINPDQQAFSVVGETVAQDAARIGQRVIDRELDLRPTIFVRQGMLFNVLVTKDLELAPYRPVIARR